MIAGRPLFIPAHDSLAPPRDYPMETSLLQELRTMNQHLQDRVNHLNDRLVALEEWARKEQFSWSDGR